MSQELQVTSESPAPRRAARAADSPRGADRHRDVPLLAHAAAFRDDPPLGDGAGPMFRPLFRGLLRRTRSRNFAAALTVTRRRSSRGPASGRRGLGGGRRRGRLARRRGAGEIERVGRAIRFCRRRAARWRGDLAQRFPFVERIDAERIRASHGARRVDGEAFGGPRLRQRAVGPGRVRDDRLQPLLPAARRRPVQGALRGLLPLSAARATC